jgi:N-methylhydantoinase A
VTDACLLMGILDPNGFAGGQMELDVEASRRAFEDLDCAIAFEQRIATAWRVALNNIAEEIVNVAIRHGADTRDFSIVAFGAGGPMLLAGTLDLTGARRLVVPPHPGLFSAIGLLSTDMVYADSRSAFHMLDPTATPAISQLLGDMEAKLRQRVPTHAVVSCRRSFDARIVGQSWDTPFIAIDEGPLQLDALVRNFHAEYLRRNGQAFPDLPVQAVAWRVQIMVQSEKIQWRPVGAQQGMPAHAATRTLRYLGGAGLEARVYDRISLGAGATIAGPAIIREDLATILVLPRQVATVGTFGEIMIERTS